MTTDPRSRSRVMIDGPDRAPARSMMRAVGYNDEDFKRPLVGVAHSWIEIMPCNINQRELAGWVKEGIREAGGTPVEMNTIAVSDGIAMGTEGMKASLISPRDRRRLDRARHARPPARCARVRERLRQDDPRNGHGARAPRHPWAHGLRRVDHAGPLPGPRRHDRRCLRGGGEARRREDDRRGAARARRRTRAPARARAAVSSRRTRWRRRSRRSGSHRPARRAFPRRIRGARKSCGRRAAARWRC